MLYANYTKFEILVNFFHFIILVGTKKIRFWPEQEEEFDLSNIQVLINWLAGILWVLEVQYILKPNRAFEEKYKKHVHV